MHLWHGFTQTVVIYPQHFVREFNFWLGNSLHYWRQFQIILTKEIIRKHTLYRGKFWHALPLDASLIIIYSCKGNLVKWQNHFMIFSVHYEFLLFYHSTLRGDIISCKLFRQPERDQYVIASKLRGDASQQRATNFSGQGTPFPNRVGLSRQAIIKNVELSLHRLNTHYIDLYQVRFLTLLSGKVTKVLDGWR